MLAEEGNTPRETVEPPKCAERTRVVREIQVPEGAEERGGEFSEDGEGRYTESPNVFLRDDFDSVHLHLDYQSLRIPMDARHISLTARRGWLRMYGRSGLPGE